MKNLCKIVMVGLLSIIMPATSFATSVTVDAYCTYVTALSATVGTTANFGLLELTSTATYVLSTAGAVSGGTTLGGSPTAASVSITGSATQTIDIYVDPGSVVSGVTPSAPTCNYNAGSETACTSGSPLTAQAAPSSGKTLLIGLSVTADGSTQVDDTQITLPMTLYVSYS